MMIISNYIHIIYAVIVWGFIFVFIKPQRIKNLLPVAVLSAVILFAAEMFLITLNLYRFNNPMISIGGIPLFHLVWGAGSGIVVMNFMKRDFASKFLLVVFFTLVTLAFEYASESIGATTHLGRYTEIHDAFQDFTILITLVWISIGLWGEIIIPDTHSKLH